MHGIIPEAFRVGRTVRFSLEAVKASLDVNNAGDGRYVVGGGVNVGWNGRFDNRMVWHG